MLNVFVAENGYLYFQTRFLSIKEMIFVAKSGYLSVEERRDKISRVYDSLKWKERVRRMPIQQVCAVYDQFVRQHKFDPPDPNYIQLNLFDDFGVEYKTRRTK